MTISSEQKPQSEQQVKELIAESSRYLCLAVLLGYCLMPSDAVAGLEGQLVKVNTLLTGSVLKVGLGGAAIVSGVYAIFKGSPAIAASIVGISIVLAYYLGWVQGDGFIIK